MSIWANTSRNPPNASPGSPASPAAPASRSILAERPPCSPMAATCAARGPDRRGAVGATAHHRRAPARLAGRPRTPGAKIGYDPMLISEEALARLREAGLDMQPVAANPIDAIWTDRPPPPAAGRSADPGTSRAKRGRQARRNRRLAAPGEAGCGGDHRSRLASPGCSTCAAPTSRSPRSRSASR